MEENMTGFFDNIAGNTASNILIAGLIGLVVFGFAILALVKLVQYGIGLVKTKATEYALELKEIEFSRDTIAQRALTQNLIDAQQKETFSKILAHKKASKQKLMDSISQFSVSEGMQRKVTNITETFDSLKKTTIADGNDVHTYIIKSIINMKGKPFVIGTDTGSNPLTEDQFSNIISNILTNEEFLFFMDNGSVNSTKNILGHNVTFNVYASNQTIQIVWNPKVTEKVELVPNSNVKRLDLDVGDFGLALEDNDLGGVFDLGGSDIDLGFDMSDMGIDLSDMGLGQDSSLASFAKDNRQGI